MPPYIHVFALYIIREEKAPMRKLIQSSEVCGKLCELAECYINLHKNKAPQTAKKKRVNSCHTYLSD